MNANHIRAAIDEAKRFIDRAEHLLGEHEARRGREYRYVGDFPKEQGAVRRASMDLTRALAEMRNLK